MNDLRTTAAINGAADRQASGISSAPPRVRPERTDDRASAGKMSRRQSIVERARQDSTDPPSEVAAPDVDGDDINELTLIDDEARERLVNAKLAERASRRDQAEKGPDSRPSRRRAKAEPVSKGEDGFPWTFQLDDEDEPEELQASTPLLSRAFRATTG